MDRELEKIIGKINLLPEDEKQQDRRDLRESFKIKQRR